MNEPAIGKTDKEKKIITLLWFLVMFYAVVLFGNNAFPEVISRPLYIVTSILFPFLFAMIHGSYRYGLKNMIFFAVSCIIISNFYENLSVMTGFPFGHYYYSDNLGVKIPNVPLIIGFAYFSLGYLSWVMSNVLLGDISPVLKKGNIFFVPVIASFAMVCWDFTFDPDSSTLNKDWIWMDGGGYFGVPFSNFPGWYLCAFTFYFVFAVYVSRRPETDFNKIFISRNRSYWYQAIIFYCLYGIGNLLKRFFQSDQTITDQTGHTWSSADLHDTIGLAAIFTMIFISILGLIRIKQDEINFKI